MEEGKIFDVKKVKVENYQKTPQNVEIEKPSVAKLHARFFDWHTVSYILYGLAIILVFITAALVTRYLIIKKQANANTPTAVDTKIADTPASADKETKSTTENPFTPAPTDTNTTTSTIDKKSIAIRVLNGNGTTGDGAKAKQQLEDAGFSIKEVGNAKRQDYTTTQIYYIAEKKEQATLVEEALKAAGRATTLEEASADLVGKDTEVLVVTGEK